MKVETKHTCNWCANCNMYDEDMYYCGVRNDFRTKRQADARNACADYNASWCRCDDGEAILGKTYDYDSARAEREKYERRMAGDWS